MTNDELDAIQAKIPLKMSMEAEEMINVTDADKQAASQIVEDARWENVAVENGEEIWTSGYNFDAIRESIALALATAREEGAKAAQLRPRSEWHEDYGPVLWWDSDVCESHEPPYMGTPNDIDQDGMYCCPLEYEWWSECPDFGPMVKAAQAALAAKEARK